MGDDDTKIYERIDKVEKEGRDGREKLYTRIDSGAEANRIAHEKTTAGMAEQTTMLGSIQTLLTTKGEEHAERMKNLENTVYGNGNPGLKTFVDRLNTKAKVAIWALGLIIGACLVWGTKVAITAAQTSPVAP